MNKRKRHQELKMASLGSPCRDCAARAIPPEPDCHNVNRCAMWKRYKEACAKISAQKRKDYLPGAVLAEDVAIRHDKYIKSDDR